MHGSMHIGAWISALFNDDSLFTGKITGIDKYGVHACYDGQKRYIDFRLIKSASYI